MQRPEMLVQDNGVPPLLAGYLRRQREMFRVNREETTIGGVHAYVYTPADGIAERNRDRVLIDLHGGGFRECWPGCAELESIPIAALGRIKVVSLDYRQGPKYRFPAASEDVAAAYRELLKTYRPENIGIYGCSAGGMLTAMSVAWFQRHGLPTTRGRRNPLRGRRERRRRGIRRRRELHDDAARRRPRRSRRRAAGSLRRAWSISRARTRTIRSSRRRALPRCSRSSRRR